MIIREGISISKVIRESPIIVGVVIYKQDPKYCIYLPQAAVFSICTWTVGTRVLGYLKFTLPLLVQVLYEHGNEIISNQKNSSKIGSTDYRFLP